MASTIWSGTVSFGLVTIPVTLHSAVRDAEGGVSFHQLHASDNSRIRYKKFCEKEGKEVPAKEIVKGYEYEKGKYVVLTDEDLKAAEMATSQAFDIAAVVDEAEIDPRYWDTPYYLKPGKGGAKAYVLLRDALRAKGKVALGSFVLRKKTHLAGLKVVGDKLVLELMRYERQVIDADEIAIPEVKDIHPKELQMAEQLVENLSESFDPSKQKDVYTENLKRVIQAKLKGKKMVVSEPADADDTPVIDLMDRLAESLKQGGAKPKRSAKGPTKAPAKKASPRRKTA